jgi:hypothetical protein
MRVTSVVVCESVCLVCVCRGARARVVTHCVAGAGAAPARLLTAAPPPTPATNANARVHHNPNTGTHAGAHVRPWLLSCPAAPAAAAAATRRRCRRAATPPAPPAPAALLPPPACPAGRQAGQVSTRMHAVWSMLPARGLVRVGRALQHSNRPCTHAPHHTTRLRGGWLAPNTRRAAASSAPGGRAGWRAPLPSAAARAG